MASAMVASPIQACQCSIGSWLVMIVAPLAGAVVDDLQQVASGWSRRGCQCPSRRAPARRSWPAAAAIARSRRCRAGCAAPRPGAARAGTAPSGRAGRRTAPARRPARTCPTPVGAGEQDRCRRARPSRDSARLISACGRSRATGARCRRPRCGACGYFSCACLQQRARACVAARVAPRGRPAAPGAPRSSGRHARAARQLFLEACGEAVQLEGAQLREGGVISMSWSLRIVGCHW